MPGTLFVVATPIGNLDDITLRALETLKSVDRIFCEDTRHSLNLLRHYGFVKPLHRYDEHVHGRASAEVIRALGQGQNIALISDAGTPAISDPGQRLIEAVRAAGFNVVPIPGASSVTAAISAIGWPGEGFVFLGFLPRKKGKAVRQLQEALRLGKTVAVLESPFRILETLTWLEEQPWLINISVVRELTKIHEEFIMGDAKTIRIQLEKRDKIGECLLLLQERN